MSNRNTGAIDFEALGKQWKIRFSTNALCEIETESGKSALELAQSMDAPGGARVSDVRLMFWAGLLEHQPDANLETAGRVIDGLGLIRAGEILGEAMIAAFPDAEPVETKPGKPKARKRR